VTKKTKIVIVEQDRFAINAIQQELKSIEWTTKIVQSKEDLEWALKQFAPDIVLSNYTLAFFDGPTVFEMKQKEKHLVPFIFVCQPIGEENVIELLKRGVTDFVSINNLSTLSYKVIRALQESGADSNEVMIQKLIYTLDKNESNYTSIKNENAATMPEGLEFEGIKAPRFARMNAASEAVLGYKPEELLGKKHTDYVFFEDVEKTVSADVGIKSGVHFRMFENRCRHKNGSVAHLLWSIFWDDVRQISYCTAKDITDKKNLEKAFEVERQRFYDLYLQAPSCMGIL
jgi:PAS domain S-box-containing protein